MKRSILSEKEGKDIMIGFNPKFLIDALRVIDDETVTICCKSEGTMLYP